jgi:hypothetical protein
MVILRDPATWREVAGKKRVPTVSPPSSCRRTSAMLAGTGHGQRGTKPRRAKNRAGRRPERSGLRAVNLKEVYP